jgi:hypothetical protein
VRAISGEDRGRIGGEFFWEILVKNRNNKKLNKRGNYECLWAKIGFQW